VKIGMAAKRARRAIRPITQVAAGVTSAPAKAIRWPGTGREGNRPRKPTGVSPASQAAPYQPVA
jgi:hypothetical protein